MTKREKGIEKMLKQSFKWKEEIKKWLTLPLILLIDKTTFAMSVSFKSQANHLFIYRFRQRFIGKVTLNLNNL